MTQSLKVANFEVLGVNKYNTDGSALFCNKYMDGCVESKTHPTLVVFSINRLASTSVTRGKKTKKPKCSKYFV